MYIHIFYSIFEFGLHFISKIHTSQNFHIQTLLTKKEAMSKLFNLLEIQGKTQIMFKNGYMLIFLFQGYLCYLT